jgi:hypothetical protein
MKYFKDERHYPFLGVLKENYLLLRRDFLDMFRLVDQQKLVMLSTARRVIRSEQTDWKALAFMMHGKAPHEHMKERGFMPPYMDEKGVDRLARAMNTLFFRESRGLLQEIAAESENGIVSMWYSYFEPGAKLGLHVNNDPYMYRAHLGLIVPDGDVGFKVKDEVIRWKEGELFVFDPTMPHTAWNLTEKPRVLFIVDFLRPEEERARMQELERAQFELMMKENPLSLFISGGYYDLDEDTVRKYAVLGVG